jgi:hypothetical protein
MSDKIKAIVSFEMNRIAKEDTMNGLRIKFVGCVGCKKRKTLTTKGLKLCKIRSGMIENFPR